MPTCLAKKDQKIEGREGLAQGFGKTENGDYPDTLLETKVKTISNQNCILNITKAVEKFKGQVKVEEIFPDGINEGLFCTVGIYNEEKNIYSVRFVRFQTVMVENEFFRDLVKEMKVVLFTLKRTRKKP